MSKKKYLAFDFLAVQTRITRISSKTPRNVNDSYAQENDWNLVQSQIDRATRATALKPYAKLRKRIRPNRNVLPAFILSLIL